MLAEKFFLVLETIISRRDPEDTRMMNSSPHVPVELPVSDILMRRPKHVLHDQRRPRSTCPCL